VQRQIHLGLVARVVDELVFARMTSPFQPATDHPLVEPFEPAQAAAALQIDELRVHNLFDRRIPSETDVAHLDLRHAHPARRRDDEA
jgi:hypothetical protein